MDYPSAGLNTVADLALRAAVSAPTVVRCVQALGYDGFPALQAALRAELTQRSNGPLASMRREYEPGTVIERLLRHADNVLQRTLASFAAIPPSDIESTVALLADTSRPLYIVGGRFSHVLAEYLALLLEQLRPRVRYLTDPFGADHAQVLDVTRRDVYVLSTSRATSGTPSSSRRSRASTASAWCCSPTSSCPPWRPTPTRRCRPRW